MTDKAWARIGPLVPMADGRGTSLARPSAYTLQHRMHGMNIQVIAGGPESAANSIRNDINGAYRAVRDPNAYSPGEFRASLGRAAAAIRRLR